MIVFPADAGMIPPIASGDHNLISVPRGCGDDPLRLHPCIELSLCSPRMRG